MFSILTIKATVSFHDESFDTVSKMSPTSVRVLTFHPRFAILE